MLSTLEGLENKYDFTITMLPNSKVLEHVLLNSPTVGQTLKKEGLWIDCSTISPLDAQRLSTVANDKFGIRLIDAPVSGGVTGADNGSLTFMIGTSESSIFEVIFG